MISRALRLNFFCYSSGRRLIPAGKPHKTRPETERHEPSRCQQFPHSRARKEYPGTSNFGAWAVRFRQIPERGGPRRGGNRQRETGVKERQENPPTTGRGEDRRIWAAFAAILVLYVFSALRVGPVNAFGSIGDDALYLSSARALANGKGYILPSFPIPMKASKYPEMYPLLLSTVWKVDPHFPGNVKVAVGLTLGFGCLALLFAFLLLRRWTGLGDWPALAAVALCAFTGSFLELSASVMTDVPFMAVLLGAIWMAEWRNRKNWGIVGAGLLAGLSVGLRSLGVAAIGGIGLVLLLNKDFRKLLWFSVAAAPLTLLSLWLALGAMFHSGGTRLAVGLDGTGWTQTLCYYSSYACSWRMGVTTPRVLEAVILTNLKSVIQEPGLYLFSPLVASNALWSVVLVTLLSIAAYAGIVRRVRADGWKPLTVTFLFFLPVILAWPYTPERFLLTFLPLFFGGLFVEGRHLTSLVARRLRPPIRAAERVAAGALAVAGLAIAATVAVNYTYAIPSQAASVAASEKQMLAAKRGAYAWIRKHAGPDARIVSYDSGLTYLYTGRPSLPATTCLSQAFYLNDARYAEHDAAHLTDVPRHIGASYWLATDADYALTGETDYTVLQRRQKELLAGAPVIYRSRDGRVVLYDVRCRWNAGGRGCARAQGRTGADSAGRL